MQFLTLRIRPMVNFNTSYTSPYQGYYPTPGSSTVPAPAPAPVTGQPATPPSAQPPAYQPDKGMSPQAALDMLRMVKHPIQTVKSLFICTKDLLALKAKR